MFFEHSGWETNYLCNSIGLSVPHRRHITSPLLAQQLNAIYRFVTMVYYYKYYNSGRYPSSLLLFETRDVSETGFCHCLQVRKKRLALSIRPKRVDTA
jgi:hypothetical protein